MNTTFKLLLVFAILALVVVGPILVIWSLNTLFPALVIDYTLKTWAAVVILGGFVSARYHSKG
jgi:hypothetical protein